LHRGVAKTTDHLREKLALQDIAAQMVDHPEQVLPKLVERAMEMTGATSAEISAYESQVKVRLGYSAGATSEASSHGSRAQPLPATTARAARALNYLARAGYASG